jgi:Electron transfer DM13
MRGNRMWLIGGAAAVAVVAVVAFGLYWFQPWKLFTSQTVNDTAPLAAAPAASAPPASGPPASGQATASPATSAAPAAVLVAKGTLVTHEHDTSGTAEVIRHPDGRRQLVFRDLSTSDGPDLRVWLTDQPVVEGRAGWHVFDDGKYVEVGRLKGTRGTLVYDLPPDLSLAGYTSVTIWCKRFAVSFGAAALVAP